MRQCLAAIVMASVCSLQAQALAFHVHRGSGDARSDRHTHAPAIHHHDHDDHQHGAVRDAHDALRLTSHEDAADTITLAVPIGGTVVGAVAAESPSYPVSFEQPRSSVAISVTDARSHGPPATWRPSFRGPPTSIQS